MCFLCVLVKAGVCSYYYYFFIIGQKWCDNQSAYCNLEKSLGSVFSFEKKEILANVWLWPITGHFRRTCPCPFRWWKPSLAQPGLSPPCASTRESESLIEWRKILLLVINSSTFYNTQVLLSDTHSTVWRWVAAVSKALGALLFGCRELEGHLWEDFMEWGTGVLARLTPRMLYPMRHEVSQDNQLLSLPFNLWVLYMAAEGGRRFCIDQTAYSIF